MVNQIDSTSTPKNNERDVQFDAAKAASIAREILRENIGNLNLAQYKLESVRQNGDKTKYIVISSIVPDVGKEREYYLIKVDILNGKVVHPVGRGKMNEKGELILEEFKVDSKWLK